MKALFQIILLCFAIKTYSQNLVPNPSFEFFSSCPNHNYQLYLATPWYGEYNNSSDGCFGHMCNHDESFVEGWFLYQKPRTGEGFTFIGVFSDPSFEYSFTTYIKVKLKEVLKKDKNYCINYYVSLGGFSKYAIDALCACLSPDSLLFHGVFSDTNKMFLNCPLINRVCNAENNILKDTLNWENVSLIYTAQGDEQYLTIGNLKRNSEVNYLTTSGYFVTVYHIDDVSVYECDAPVYEANAGEDKTACIGEQLTLGTPAREQYLYQWFNEQGQLISNSATLKITATESTYYILKQKDFKFDETIDTVYITVDPECVVIPNIITPNNDNKNDYFVIPSLASLKIELQIYNRWGRLVYRSDNYQNHWNAEGMSDGVYFYIAKITTQTQRVIYKQGSVTLMR